MRENELNEIDRLKVRQNPSLVRQYQRVSISIDPVLTIGLRVGRP